jgi:leucyl aminopeptidase
LRADDAVLVMVPLDARAADFNALPDPERWRGLDACAPRVAGNVRSSTLANAAQSLTVIGYRKPDSTPFERLELAGRMLKDTAGRAPRRVVLASLGSSRPPFEVKADLTALLCAALARAFELPTFKRASAPPPVRIEAIDIAVPGGEAVLSASELAYLGAAARGNNLARWLTALPPNVLDARSYRQLLGRLARRHALRLRWLDEPALKRLGAHAFLAVAAGNATRSAGIAHLSYRPSSGPRARGGARGTAAVALVGKGILFDTGGNNLKHHRGMLDMHIDMAGSAVALATLIALAELRAPFAADAWLAITENRIGASAYRPQDVVRAVNGVTIQVIHTDAEGRMVLADTLALAARTQPRLMLDFATLTGACVTALTERMSGVFTNDGSLVAPLLDAGRASGERVWNFPMDEDYDSDLESKVADIVQCAVDGKGDHILAARFLKRFVPDDIAWAHVDLAAAMRAGGLADIGTDITGFGVRFTLELLLRQSVLTRRGAR